MAVNRNKIQAALQKPYNRILFGKEILNPVFNSGFSLHASPAEAAIKPNKSESAVIDRVWIYGEIKLEDGTDVTCYEIQLQPDKRIEQNKIAVQHYVRKLLTVGQAALVNFISPASPNTWRLTLIAKDSEITEKGVKEKTTHAKRYTFLLGSSESCKTAAERFEVLSTERKIDFQALVRAFSVEKLSKAFFDEYTQHYLKFCNYLQDSAFRRSVFSISFPAGATQQEKDKACKPIRDFTKKLLGRIVFLYFVQKKGWLGASTVDYKDGMPDFIMQLFKTSSGDESFYNNWLSVLFFDTLNKYRTNDDFKMPDGKQVKIPFLNGGLFDKEEYDENLLTFPPTLFHNSDNPEEPNYRGFFDFLNAFNFTVHEDSPDDQIVAVDPEMLGHIFENLLEDNKDKGTYYTPKEIVHYMCQESLIEYLTTHLSKEYTVYRQLSNDQVELFGNESRKGQLKMVEELGEKALSRDDVEYIVKYKDISRLTKDQLLRKGQLLDTVKICDPAIGSGAFPMGLLQEIFAIKEVVAYETNKQWKPAIVKENIIQNSIYGVDIEKGAVDIARLRFWLSLIVDADKPLALPNLDYKIVVGDSLLSKVRIDDKEEIIEIDWERKSSVGKADVFVQNVQRLLKEIAEKQKQYFHPEKKDKKELAQEIRDLKIELLINQLSFNKQKYINNTPQKGGYAPTAKDIQHNTERELMIKNFDNIVRKLQILKKESDKPFAHFDWKLDFPEVLNPYLVNGSGGFDIVIANPPYVDIKNLPTELVDILFDKYETTENRINLYSIFIEKSWSLLKQDGVISFINPNSLLLNSSYKKIRKHIINGIDKIIKLPDNVFINAIVETIIFEAKKGKFGGHVAGAFYKNDEKIDFAKLKFETFNAADWKADPSCRFNIFVSVEISNILKSIDNSNVDILDNYFDFSLGITPYDKHKGHTPEIIENRAFHSTKQLNENYVPLLSGSNILRYSIEGEIEEYLNYGDWLGAPRQLKFFTSPRVVVRQIISGHPPRIYAAYTEKELYHTQIGFSIIRKKGGKYSPKLLCAILNSQLISFYHKFKFTDPEKDTFQKILIENCKAIPIPKSIAQKTLDNIDTIVDYILFVKSENLKDLQDQLMPIYFDQIIDGIMYEIYFPALLQKHERGIDKHLGELPELTESITYEKKLSIVKTVFNRLNDKNHPVRTNLFYMDSIPEIRIIEGKNENN